MTLGNSAEDKPAARIQREQTPAQSLPSTLRVRYYDPALDYQEGEARASSGSRQGTDDQQQLPAAVAAEDAKSLAQRMIAREWAARDRLTLRLPPSFLDLQPGAQVELDATPRFWRVEQCTIDSFVLVAELRPATGPNVLIAAEAGRIVPSQDVPVSDTSLALFDIPDVLEQGASTPTLTLAASSPDLAFKAANVELSFGEQSQQVQSARKKAVLGRSTNVLGAGTPFMFDRVGAIDVELIDPEQWLVSCNDEALAGGSNLAAVGREVLQFGSAEPLGEGRFRLTRLLRGRGGTEWARAMHSAGEAFVLLQPDTLRSVPMPSWTVGANVVASTRNLSGATSVSDPVALSGAAMRPLSPVRLRGTMDGGDLLLSWIRRSRRGMAWLDGVDAPLAESREMYRVSLEGPAAAIELEISEPSARIGAAQLSPLGSGIISISLRQIGDGGASYPATLTIGI